MHTPDWRQSLAELCRVADRLVIFDYPSATSAALVQSVAAADVQRRRGTDGGLPRLPARDDSERAGRLAVQDPIGASAVRPAHPAAQDDRVARLHDPVGARARSPRPAAAARVAGHGLRGADTVGGADTVRGAHTVLVTGATGFTGGHLARALAAAHPVRALVRDPARARRPEVRRASRFVSGRPAGPRGAPGGRRRRRRRVSHRRDLPVGRRPGRDLPGHQPHGRRRARRGRGRRRASAASCTAARSASTATSTIRRPTKTRRSSPATSTRSRSSKERTSRRETAARSGIELTIARPSGIYGPGDRRLLKLFKNVVRRFPILGSGQIYYHLTYIDDLVEGFRLCGEHPAAAGRTYILAGGEVTTLVELMTLIAGAAGVRPPSMHLPVWPFWMAGAACEAVCVPFGIEPPHLPPPRGLLHQEPRVRHHPRPRPKSATSRASAFATASPARWPGTVNMAGSSPPGFRTSCSRPTVAAREVREPRRRPARSRRPCSSTSWSSCSRRRAPAPSGLVLRKQLYPWLLGSCGRNVVFGQNVVVRHPHKIHIGSNVVIDDNCLLDAKGESNRGIRIGDGVFVGRNSILSCKDGDIELGDRRQHRLQLRGVLGEPRDDRRRRPDGGVRLRHRRRSRLLGSGASPSWIRREPPPASTIGDGAWLGAGAKVLDGVTIGSHAVIGAGAVVRDAVPDHAVAVGVPAQSRVVSGDAHLGPADGRSRRCHLQSAGR